MARGNVPRQPSRSGRQEGCAPGGCSAKAASRLDREHKRRGQPKVDATTVEEAQGQQVAEDFRLKKKSASGYNPLAPERVRQIIAGLDEMYPE